MTAAAASTAPMPRRRPALGALRISQVGAASTLGTLSAAPLLSGQLGASMVQVSPPVSWVPGHDAVWL
jgi:hypothetical protein